MYVIVEAGGRQWKVEPGSQLDINRVSTEVGATHTLERVLFAHDGTQVQIGRPYLKDTKVVCEVLAHPRGPKRIAYHFRRRENWRKTVGHRQDLSRLLVKEILHAGQVLKAGAAGSTPKTRTPKAGAPKRAVTNKPAKTAKPTTAAKTAKPATAAKSAKPTARKPKTG